MKYQKPALTQLGNAASIIQSSLAKDNKETDHISGPFTAAAAYQADE
jgi:hypothetical protein